jgi:hypothetical protein
VGLPHAGHRRTREACFGSPLISPTGIQRTASRWTGNRYPPLRPSRFVKFVHFHSVISSNLPQGVSESGRWRVCRQRSCPNSPNWDVCPPCFSAGESPSRRKRSAVRARAADISDNPAPWQIRPAYAACGPTRGDASPFVGADRWSVLQRRGTARDAFKLWNLQRHREAREALHHP